jgi:hypothetical protein
MIANAKSAEVGLMNHLNHPFTICSTFLVSVYDSAVVNFVPLVEDRGKWDFKHRIKELLGDEVILCSTTICKNDVEYSVLGNIHFGYIGRASRFPGGVLQMGAAYAELGDPSHYPLWDQDAPFVSGFGPVNLPFFQWTILQGSYINWGDDPKDAFASAFGMYLWDKYGSMMTQWEFRSELNLSFSGLATKQPEVDPIEQWVIEAYPYREGFFSPTK